MFTALNRDRLLWQFVLSWQVFSSVQWSCCAPDTIPECFPSFHPHGYQQNIGSWNNGQMRACISWILPLPFYPQTAVLIIDCMYAKRPFLLKKSIPRFLQISPHNSFAIFFSRSMVKLKSPGHLVVKNTISEKPFNGLSRVVLSYFLELWMNRRIFGSDWKNSNYVHC